MKILLTFTIICLPIIGKAQNISATQLLDNSINYHDPDSKWNSFNSTFTIEMTTPNTAKRTSKISIDLLGDYFNVNAKQDSIEKTYTITKNVCKMSYNSKILDSLQAKAKNMSCTKATLYKNYYTYLYGLPMKLKDPGTNISNTVEKKTFKDKNYLVIKVTYDKTVGNDVWYFYFNPTTYAMEMYQFFKTDTNGKEKSNSGEYILLSEIAIINGIKMPKIRTWYYNKNNTYLGTDNLLYN